MTPLLKRIVEEKRSVVLPLAVALVANMLAYGFVVYPLGVKSAGAADRAAAAQAARLAAERDEALAQALVTGKSRADEELSAFYEKVLPASQAAARRMTYSSLPALAHKTNLRFEERRFSVEDEKVGKDQETPLGHLAIRMVLQGQYQNIRSFIYQLESAPEFVIIDDVTLLEGNDNESQTLTIDLSTYFHQRPNGT